MVTRKTTAKKTTAAKMTAKARSEAAKKTTGTENIAPNASSGEGTKPAAGTAAAEPKAVATAAKAATEPKAAEAAAKATTGSKAATSEAKPAAAAAKVAVETKVIAESKATEAAAKPATEPKPEAAAAKATSKVEAPKAASRTKAATSKTSSKAAATADSKTTPATEPKPAATKAKSSGVKKSTAKTVSATASAAPETEAAETPKKTRARKTTAEASSTTGTEGAATKAKPAKKPASKAAVKTTKAAKTPTAAPVTPEAPTTPEVATIAAPTDTAPDHSSALAQAQVKAAAAARTKARRSKGVLGTAPTGPLVEGVPSPAEAPVAEFADLPPVLIAAAESAPLAKTGGLADVVGALPKYLKALGIDARIIMPFHRVIKERYATQTTHLFDYNAGGQWASRFVGIDKLELDGTIYYFVDNEYYFGGEIYSGDNFEGDQYGFFVQAVCDALPNLDFNPGIIHGNDWHTALLPLKLRARAAREGYWPPALLLTIHNLAFQGWWGKELDAKLIGPDEKAIAWDLGVWNMLKAGIDLADRVNTVSPTYAGEICNPEFGEGLQDDLRSVRDQGRLWGILNGIDYDVWNPETDPCLPAHYNVANREGKQECKRALLAELGLDDDVDAPLIAFVGRLTPQKGVQLIPQIIDTCVPQGAKFVILGSGHSDLEWAMRDAENRYRGRVCSYIGYNSDLSHRIYAGSDFLLMPSAFEPCGISQMIAMRYGSLPIVHEVGGLKDTVSPYNYVTGDGDGFSFYHFDAFDATEAVKRALDIYWNKEIMNNLVTHAMTKDFSFARCAHMYAELYRNMCS